METYAHFSKIIFVLFRANLNSTLYTCMAVQNPLVYIV